MPKVRVKYVTSALREHHDKILEAVALLDKVLSSPSPDPEAVHFLIQFIQRFVDQCHHSIEEYVLFQGVNRQGFPYLGSPIYVMTSEHGIGRYLARVMEELYTAWKNGDQNALKELADYAKLYIDHISEHIMKENNVLFPMLESSYSEVSSSRTVEDIEKENQHDYWMAKLEELKKSWSGQ
ncbi:MAG: hemerythrin domain-containing protein [Pyrobaculum sp.]|nr:hemerythrin domain-containing protein [Pyrobaculum sp.]